MIRGDVPNDERVDEHIAAAGRGSASLASTSIQTSTISSRRSARTPKLTFAADARIRPELIIVAQNRPGVVGSHRVERLRRSAPLAGVISLLGSWCEGQARTGRPMHGTLRLYWHEFAPWWRRQLALRATGRCPDWGRPDSIGLQSPSLCTSCSVLRTPHSIFHGVIALSTPGWETADALADVLQRAGYATVWQPPGGAAPAVRGATAGIWEGGQLDDREAEELAAFCRRLAGDSAPRCRAAGFSAPRSLRSRPPGRRRGRAWQAVAQRGSFGDGVLVGS